MVLGSLVGDSLASVRAAGAPADALRNIAWLEMELASGLKVEVIPTAKVVRGIEQLGLSVDIVPVFRESHQWPGGPLEPRETLEAFASTLGRPIADVALEVSTGGIIADQLIIRFWGAPAIRVVHDQSMPQSLFLKPLAEVPSNNRMETDA